jgi:hypothetical protein
MSKLGSLTGGLLVLASTQLYAEEPPSAVPFEVGQRVGIALAKPYRTAEGVRVSTTWTEVAGKPLLTVAANGRESTMTQPTARGRVRGQLTSVDDAGFTLNLGARQPFLRIPREAVLPLEPPPLPPRHAKPPIPAETEPEEEPYPVSVPVGEKVEIALAKPYRAADGVRVKVVSTELSGKPLMTVARGQEGTMTQPTERAHVHGLLTAVDNRWLTLNLGGKQPFLRIPRKAIVQIVPWDGWLPQDESATLATGPSIRIVSTELGPGELPGNLLASSNEALLVKVAGRAEPIRVRRSSVERLYVLRRHSGSGEGALIGGVALGIAGALAGALLSSFPIIDCESRQCGKSHPGPGQGLGLGFLVGAICGAPIGAAAGSGSKGERWDRVSLSAGPQRHGGRAALSLRF